MMYEKTSDRDVYISSYRFICENCGSHSITRSVQSSKPGSNDTITFYCGECGEKSHHIYDKKKGTAIKFDEYLEVIGK